MIALLENDLKRMGLYPLPPHLKLKGPVNEHTHLSKRVGNAVPRAVTPPITHLRVVSMLVFDSFYLETGDGTIPLYLKTDTKCEGRGTEGFDQMEIIALKFVQTLSFSRSPSRNALRSTTKDYRLILTRENRQ